MVDRAKPKSYVPDLRVISADPQHIGDVLYVELMRISAAIQAVEAGHLDPIYVAESKPREGDIRMAKSPLNLGAGDGVYAYIGGAWVKMT